MLISKIDYLNLLPFYVFVKKNITSTQIKAIINYKKSYPSQINQEFKYKRTDAAFISSIKSRNCKCTDIGIVAKDSVWSVLVLINEANKDDFESNTSNILANILDIQGQVVIGDKALKIYYKNEDEFIDLAQIWYEKYGVSFVFARFCYNKHKNYFQKLAKSFGNSKIKIPQYILQKEAQKTGLSQKQILDYLKQIKYNIGIKEKKSLKLFFRKIDEKKFLK
jgi:chorismate dehydratase